MVLKSLFDPEASTTPEAKSSPPSTSLPGIPGQQFCAARAIEVGIIAPLHHGTPTLETVRKAIDELSSLITRYPSYSSAYINRAQATRFLIPIDGLFTSEYSEASTQLLTDLQHGITLASPLSLDPPLSTHQTTVLAAAHTHRGFLLLKLANLVSEGKPVFGVSESLQSASAESIEEQASRDFAAGGKYGDARAKEMAVRTNPYAKMCGAIVKEALKKEGEEWRASQSC